MSAAYSIEENRKFVAALIRRVLTGKMTSREAVLQFPKNAQDKSIEASYHALVHFEADEDLRNRDPLYKEEQDDYLEFISYVLDRGEDLPDNIIKSYEKYYDGMNIPNEEGTKGFWKSFMKFLNI